MHRLFALACLTSLLVAHAAGAAPPEPAAIPVPIPFDTTWQLSGDDSRIEPVRGTTALRLRNGLAIHPATSFLNGSLEFDLEVTRHRSFVYLQFRRQSDRDFEAIYFRPHKSELPDATQYDPVWNGESAWQLFHDPGSTRPVYLPRGEWISVRLEVEGRRAALFLNGAPEPVQTVELAREPAPGSIALRAFTPPDGAPPGVMTATFANLRVRPGPSSHRFAEPPAAAPVPAGRITRWQVSPAFAAEKAALQRLPPSSSTERAAWPAFDAEANGVLIVGRHIARPAPSSGVVARLRLRSDTQRSLRLRLGFSDFVTVFVNGLAHFSGDAHYSFDQPRQEGLIGLQQSTLWLPLRAGENEILFTLTDSFGGWGLIAELDPQVGVEWIRP